MGFSIPLKTWKRFGAYDLNPKPLTDQNRNPNKNSATTRVRVLLEIRGKVHFIPELFQPKERVYPEELRHSLKE